VQLFLTAIALALIWFWWDSGGTREIALRVAKKACEELGVQLLDDTVSVRKIRLKRTNAGPMGLARIYGFEFTATGAERHIGYVAMLGKRIINIELDKPEDFIV